MIFVSSSCVRTETIGSAVDRLAGLGYSNIELSGGTEYSETLEEDLLALKRDRGLELLCHNYFPPPREHFVLNLASLDDRVFERSFDHCREAIRLSERLGAKKYAFHAGFFIDIAVDEVGKKIRKSALFDRDKAMERFCNAVNELRRHASDRVELYVENNVLSRENLETYGENPLMLTTADEYEALRRRLDVNVLVDVAHLMVSCNSLSLDFQDNLHRLAGMTDYVHVSDNNGERDANEGLFVGGAMHEALKGLDLSGKTLTLEVYEGPEALRRSYEILAELV